MVGLPFACILFLVSLVPGAADNDNANDNDNDNDNASAQACNMKLGNNNNNASAQAMTAFGQKAPAEIALYGLDGKGVGRRAGGTKDYRDYLFDFAACAKTFAHAPNGAWWDFVIVLFCMYFCYCRIIAPNIKIVNARSVSTELTCVVPECVKAVEQDEDQVEKDSSIHRSAEPEAEPESKFEESTLQNALALVTRKPKAFKNIPNKFKRNTKFIIAMLERRLACRPNNTCRQSRLDVRVEPKREKLNSVNKYLYATPEVFVSNLNDYEVFGDGKFELPFGTGVGEDTEESKVEIIMLDAYAGQINFIRYIDDDIVQDAKVLELLFEVDCVAVLFNDLSRREKLSDTSWKRHEIKKKECEIRIEEWYSHHVKISGEVQRLWSWPTKFWQPKDKKPIAIADNIHFWIECVRRTSNPSLLAEAPYYILLDEDKMLEALHVYTELFRVMPWKLRVSETFKLKVQDQFPNRFLWITLEDSRAEIPSKTRDSEMGEMINAFKAVQKATGKEQSKVPFLQLCSADLKAKPAAERQRQEVKEETDEKTLIFLCSERDRESANPTYVSQGPGEGVHPIAVWKETVVWMDVQLDDAGYFYYGPTVKTLDRCKPSDANTNKLRVVHNSDRIIDWRCYVRSSF